MWRYHGRMAKLLLNLRNVPEDEANEVSALLDAHGIAWYVTPPSPWGISFGGIWLREASDHPRAKALLADYQQRRGEAARALRQAQLRDGTAETFADHIRRRPVFVVSGLLAMLAAAALVLLPFFLLRG